MIDRESYMNIISKSVIENRSQDWTIHTATQLSLGLTRTLISLLNIVSCPFNFQAPTIVFGVILYPWMLRISFYVASGYMMKMRRTLESQTLKHPCIMEKGVVLNPSHSKIDWKSKEWVDSASEIHKTSTLCVDEPCYKFDLTCREFRPKEL